MTLGSQTGSLAVGQGQTSHLQPAEYRLRMLESITVFKLHILIPHSDAALDKNLPACVAQLLKVQLLWGTDSGCSESM